MVADEVDFVVGVDTHRDQHTLVVVASPSGGELGAAVVEARASGYEAALALAGERAPGRRAWAIEGTGSYGKGLARFLAERGERVLEVERPRRKQPVGRGKSDRLDALRAARALLGEARPAVPRAAGGREAVRMLLATRASAVAARTSALNQLRALLLSCPQPLRAELSGLTRARLIACCRSLDASGVDDLELHGALQALRLVAARVHALTIEARELEHELLRLSRQLIPALLAERGVGPITAAQIFVSWSHHGRFASEAAFAHHAGAAPIPASSGITTRHRLDRGGDRKLNYALHQIVISRRKNDPNTIAYIQRRRAEGKTDRDTIRSLKRYLARHLYRTLEATPRPLDS